MINPLPNTFCGSMLGSVWAAEPDLVIKAVKLQDVNHGMETQILSVIRGTTNEDTIMVWGDNGNLCRRYTSLFNAADTFILALHVLDSTSTMDSLESFGEYEISICGLFYLNVLGDSVYGQISGDTSIMSYTAFENYIANDVYLTNCVPLINGLIVCTDLVEFKIHPNPTSGKFKVWSLEFEVGVVQVFDLLGREVQGIRRKASAGAIEIDLSSYPAGIYFVKVGETVRKLVLQ